MTVKLDISLRGMRIDPLMAAMAPSKLLILSMDYAKGRYEAIEVAVSTMEAKVHYPKCPFDFKSINNTVCSVNEHLAVAMVSDRAGNNQLVSYKMGSSLIKECVTVSAE